ncbi:glycosyltransferase family 2 protein [Candidatus Methylacidiphilum infernorum]|uniref:Glycosyltransferase family 2 protein n=1 Tax=Candidatus Methylacidiphilum infernorum TaxID=511746 RepID=A0ABX7PTE9_9BACT|nr:glycosyltransferase family A protein [Candidatus Methylacidiphilum infernorum]QSR86256.1 glycosyltransferase family 2 protein [Candidatus Methylacidiphilum infernorum]
MRYQPLVTIAIAACNGEKTIEKAVLSALNLSWPNKEIIVIDNGSTDKTTEILKKFGQNLYCHFFKEKLGRAKARNEALQRARGSWIQWLDQDDTLIQDKIKNHFSNVCDAERVDVYYSPIIAVSPRGEKKTVPPARSMNRTPLILWFSSELPQTGGYLWKTEAVKKIGGWSDEASLFDDYELVGRAIRANLNFAFTPIPGAYWNYKDKPMDHLQALEFIYQKKKCMDNMVRWLEQQGSMDLSLKREIGKAYFVIARWLAKEGRIEEAAALERKQKAMNLFCVDDSWIYHCLYSLFGFPTTEKIQKFFRKKKQR